MQRQQCPAQQELELQGNPFAGIHVAKGREGAPDGVNQALRYAAHAACTCCGIRADATVSVPRICGKGNNTGY
jgi:hypothetical protein